MTRALAHYVPFEMALVGLFELALSFLLIYGAILLPDITEQLAISSAELSRNGAVMAAILALTVAGIAAIVGLYRPDAYLDRKRLLVNAILIGLVAMPAVLLLSGGLHDTPKSTQVLWLGKIVIIWLAGLLTGRLALRHMIRRNRLARRILIIGSGPRASRLYDRLRAHRGRLFEPLLSGGNTTSLTADALRKQHIWGVAVTGDATTQAPVDTLLDSKLRGTRVFNEIAVHERLLGRIELDRIDTGWLLFADGFASNRVSAAIKRAFDLIVSGTLLLLTLPLMVVVAALVRLDSPGPVFYRQLRSGLHGKPFVLFKFRSMSIDAEAGGRPRWAQKHDPRITRVGSYIRPMRIDELPQLINVMRGDMSMIGPRPERPHFVKELTHLIPFYRERAYVKPGITGWAQVNFPYGASVEDAREKLSYDLYYVKNRNLLLDLLILAGTVRVILLREGAR